eukprot:TRINITY_DN585_c0_g1_i1.p1 TRINITY_DN585_c0_g1~~TRINITY_DN585_c0_g1_i1.p1  ORF type:complete len:406 (-),score=45.33 TRINITY_DN585_c0_g1_i1:275-1492(-)
MSRVRSLALAACLAVAMSDDGFLAARLEDSNETAGRPESGGDELPSFQLTSNETGSSTLSEEDVLAQTNASEAEEVIAAQLETWSTSAGVPTPKEDAETETGNETAFSPASGSLVGANTWNDHGFDMFLGKQGHLCLSVEGNHFKNGAKVQAWTCKSAKGQRFKFNAWDATLRPVHAPHYCVVTHYNKCEPGTKLKLWKCNKAGNGKYWVEEEKKFWGHTDTFVRYLSKANGHVCIGIEKAHARKGDWAKLASTSDWRSRQCFYRRVSSAVTPSPTPSPAWSPTPSPAWSPTPSPAWRPTPSPAWNPTPSPAWSPSPSPHCGAAGSVCGSHGHVTQECCHAMACEQSSHEDVMKCMECANERDVCGSNGRVTKHCCLGFECRAAYNSALDSGQHTTALMECQRAR